MSQAVQSPVTRMVINSSGSAIPARRFVTRATDTAVIRHGLAFESVAISGGPTEVILGVTVGPIGVGETGVVISQGYCLLQTDGSITKQAAVTSGADGLGDVNAGSSDDTAAYALEDDHVLEGTDTLSTPGPDYIADGASSPTFAWVYVDTVVTTNIADGTV